MSQSLSSNELKILKFLAEHKEGTELKTLAKSLDMNADYVRYLVEKLKSSGYVEVIQQVEVYYTPGQKLLKLKTLPEKLIYDFIVSKEGEIELREILQQMLNMSLDDVKAGIGKLREMGVIKISSSDHKRIVKVIKEYPKNVLAVVEKLIREGRVPENAISKNELNIIKMLMKRPNFVTKEVIKREIVSVTDKGYSYATRLKVTQEALPLITMLTPEIIKSGLWRRARFKGYDLSIAGKPVFGGRKHPMRELLDEIREVWISMGFIEEWGPLIELSFWNFDALFQPQDHPARDMHDTFYLKEPKYGELPSRSVVEKVGMTHENGWLTGSKGWGYKWDENVARALILRTHTTSVTVRKVYEYGEKPVKIFAMGKVFRNETVDYKHLAEFYMVDGIIIDPNANLRELFGVLETFYKKLGFKKVLFWPSYFPYTEPSAQVCVYVDKLGSYLEMAGSGIFRPEVTVPLGVKWPVLAWGIGIERILMVRHSIDDVRIIYRNDLGFLREV